MNNLPENLHFGLPYADFSPTTSLHDAVLHSPQLQHTAHLGDQFQTLSPSYAPFPILQATMQPPQLHQPTVDLTKDLTPPKPKPAKKNRNDGMPAPMRVTRPPNAFLLFNKEMRKKLKEQNPSMKVAEISKEIGERWKTLSQADKDRYVNEANKIKETQRALHPNSMYIRRSKAELAKAGHYSKSKNKADDNPSDIFADNNLVQFLNIPNTPMRHTSSQTQRRKHRRDKNPAAPKHPLSAYMWYLTEVRPDTMRTYPGSTVGQISKLCAERWNTMTPAEQLPWKTKAQADKARYAREMQIYAAQNDHPMGRGTRQKYRSVSAAAAAAEAAALIDPLEDSTSLFITDAKEQGC